MRSEHEREAGFQREVSTNRGASRSWEHDRDTLHRTDSDARRHPRLPRRGTRRRTSPPTTGRRPTRSLNGRWSGSGTTLGLSRAGKGRVREFLAKVTGYSDSQLSRLIAQQRRTGRIRDHRLRPPARPFATVYTTADAVLLAEVDEAFGQPSGPAIKRILWRQYHVFGDERFKRLAWDFERPHLQPAGTAGRTGVPGPRSGRPGGRYRRSASGADPGRRAGRVSYALTPSTAATWAARRGPT